MNARYDYAIVGGGPAGLAVAILAARAWPRLLRSQIVLSRLVLRLATDGALRRRVMVGLRDAPGSFGAFLALATGAWGWGRALPGIAQLGLRTLTSRTAAGRSGASARVSSP